MATQQNLEFTQGSTFRASMTWESNGSPKDLTGYLFRMQVRTTYADLDTGTPWVDIDSDIKGGITVTELAGKVDIVIPAETIRVMPKGKYVYDLEYVDPFNEPDKLYYGNVTVRPEVTRG